MPKNNEDDPNGVKSFDGFSIAHKHQLFEHCEKAGISFEEFCKMLAHPSVMRHALRAGLNQRPFADFRETVERDANDLSIAGLFVERRSTSGVGKMSRMIMSGSDRLFGRADAAMHGLEQRYQVDAGECLPFATLTLHAWEDTSWAHYGAWMREIYDGERAFEYDQDYMRDAPFPPGVEPISVRVVFLKLLEVDERTYGFPLIPEGFEPASYEVFEAMRRFPNFLTWLRRHPRGGNREHVRIRHRNLAAPWVASNGEELQTTIRFRGSCRAPVIEPLRPVPIATIGLNDVLPCIQTVYQTSLKEVLANW